MRRFFAYCVTPIICLALAGCGGGSAITSTPTGPTTATPTPLTSTAPAQATTPATSKTPSGEGATVTATANTGPRWSAQMKGAVEGGTVSTDVPDCQKPADYAVTLTGKLAGGGDITLAIKGSPGTYDLTKAYDTRPSVDLKIPDATFGEWFAATAATGGSGKVTIQPDGGGSMDATLPPINGVAASNSTVRIVAAWICP